MPPTMGKVALINVRRRVETTRRKVSLPIQFISTTQKEGRKRREDATHVFSQHTHRHRASVTPTGSAVAAGVTVCVKEVDLAIITEAGTLPMLAYSKVLALYLAAHPRLAAPPQLCAAPPLRDDGGDDGVLQQRMQAVRGGASRRKMKPRA